MTEKEMIVKAKNAGSAEEIIAIQQIIANSRRNGTSLHSPAE